MALDIELLVILGLLIAIVLILTYDRRTVGVLETKLRSKQTGAYNIGAQQVKGDFAQILGTFGILGEYEELVFLSTSSKQASLDMLGVKPDSIDFIELKKKRSKPPAWGKESSTTRGAEESRISNRRSGASGNRETATKNLIF